MADEVVYKVRLEGVADMASQIDGLENRLGNLGKAVREAFSVKGPSTIMEKKFWELPGLSRNRSRLYDIFSWERTKNNRQWIAPMFLPQGKDAGRDVANAFRAAHRLHDEYARIFGKGTGDFRGGIIPAYSAVSSAFSRLGISKAFGGGGGFTGGIFGGFGRGFAQRLLGFDGNISQMVFGRGRNADAIDAESWWSGGDERARTRRMRRPESTYNYRWEFRNPYSEDPFDFYVNRKRKRSSWSDRIYSSIESLVPKGDARDVIGRIRGMGPLGRGIGLFIAGILATTAALAILKRAISLLFAPLKALADDVFKFYRTRHQIGDTSLGRGNSILSRMGVAGYIMGGKPEENFALMQRIAGERASLMWGGDGGKFMSVARRFGVDISGSRAGGLATEREWLRAIATRMQELDSSGRLALANEAGLSREQMWLVSNGLRYFDWATSRRTLAQMAWGNVVGEDVYTENFQKESQNFWTDFGMFMTAFKEFWGSVSEILLPVVNLILNVLTGLFNVVNFFLKPIATLIGKIFSLLNISFWTNMSNMESSMPSYGRYDMGMIQTATHAHPNASVSVGEINVTSSNADPEEVSKEVGNAVVNATLARIYDVSVGGVERSIA